MQPKSQISTDPDGTPILRAERTFGNQVRVFCPYCREYRRRKQGAWHYHGDGGRAGPDLGHRVAHCWDEDSPWHFRNGGGGYYLRLDDDAQEEAQNDG